MRTDFREFDPDHLAIHDQLAAEYNRTTAVDFSKFAAPIELDARDYGLGDGTTSNFQALTDAFTATSATRTDPATGKIVAGSALKIPSGTWAVTPPAGPVYGSVFPIIAPSNQNNGGSIWITGPASGSCTLETTGPLGHALQITSATRGANSAVSPFTGNTITLGFATAHNAVVGQTIYLRLLSRGRSVPAHYTVIAIPDATHIQYKVAAVDDGTGHTPSGGNLDNLIPPLTYTTYLDPSTPTTVNNTCYFLEYFFEPLNFKQPHGCFIDRIGFSPGSPLDSPLDGIGLRMGSRVRAMDDCAISDFWINAAFNGTPHVHPSIPAAAQGPQNTDHNWITSKSILSATMYQIAFIDNSSTSYFRKNSGPGLGGGRDNHMFATNIGGTGFAGIGFNDAGNFETMDWGGLSNLKGGSYPLYFEGVDGVDPCEPTGIDCVHGAVKIESPGSYSFAFDETKRRELVKTLGFYLRMESTVDINAADTGTPGGAGSTAQGTFLDATDKPWAATNVSLATVSGMPILTATVPAAMFGADGGCDIGTHLVIGLAERDASWSPYAADGVTTVNSVSGGNPVPFTGTFASASIAANGGFTADDVGLRIDCPGLHGGSDTIHSVVNSSTVTLTGVVTSAGTAKAWTVKNDGTVTQSGVNHEVIVKTVTAPSSGLVTITGEYPRYGTGSGGVGTGLDLVGPYKAMAGELGHIRAGSLHSWEPTCIFDTIALDSMTHASQFFDLVTLTTGAVNLIQDDSGSATRRVLPHFRVQDAITRGSPANDGSVTGTAFTSPSARFTAFDVGRTMTAVGLNAGAGGDTIASVQSPTQCTMTHAATTGSGLAWLIGPSHSVTAFRFVIRRGSQIFQMFQNVGTADIILGNYLEFSADGVNNFGVRRATADKLHPAAGVAIGYALGSKLGSSFSTGTVGTGASRSYYQSSVIPVAMPGTQLTLADDPTQLVSGATIVGPLIIDNGDGRVVDAVQTTPGVPDAGQRAVGFTARGVSGANAAVDAYLLVPYWTT